VKAIAFSLHPLKRVIAVEHFKDFIAQQIVHDFLMGEFQQDLLKAVRAGFNVQANLGYGNDPDETSLSAPRTLISRGL
jgi:hypothetical protein